MYKASADILLLTSVIGSLPRPAWHTASLNPAQPRIFRDVQCYQPALAALNEGDADTITDQVAGLIRDMVRKELGIAEVECLAADPRYSLAL